MSWVPPKLLRRLVLAPLDLVACLALVIAFPVLAVLAAVIDLVAGRGRALRALAFVTLFCAFEVMGLLAVTWLWVAAGAGRRLDGRRSQDRHYRLMAWWLAHLRGGATRLFGIRVEVEEPLVPRPGPILVFARHGGAGNSLMLVASLLLEYHRRPRVVMACKLQWEPLFDIFLNRLPNGFIQQGGADREAQLEIIASVATGLGDHDAFVLFPEGRDFTPDVRTRAIASLRRRGHVESAELAEEMHHVLPPRHGGVTAAIQAAPEADVVFVAHTVFEDLGSLADLWRKLPLEKPVLARSWRVPAEEVPDDPEVLLTWLYAWWALIDQWIAERTGPPAGSGAVA